MSKHKGDVDVHVTLHDERAWRRDGKDAKGSTWGKGKSRGRSRSKVGRKVNVKGYYRSDGTYVSPHKMTVTKKFERSARRNGKKSAGW